MEPDALTDAELLAGPTEVELDPGEPAHLVVLADGRVGYASTGAFRPVGTDETLERITVNAGTARGTSLIALEFADGEVRATVAESRAALSKRLRTQGFSVSAQQLRPAGALPPVQAVERVSTDSTEPLAAQPATQLAAQTAPATGPIPAPTRAPAPAAATATQRRQPAPADEPIRQRQRRSAFDTLRGARPGAGAVGRGSLSLLRAAVLVVGLVVVAILVIYVLLVLTKANPDNDLVKFFAKRSKPLAWKFKDLFEPRTRKANITENYGLAAIVYLVVTLAIAGVLARLRGAKKPR